MLLPTSEMKHSSLSIGFEHSFSTLSPATCLTALSRQSAAARYPSPSRGKPLDVVEEDASLQLLQPTLCAHTRLPPDSRKLPPATEATSQRPAFSSPVGDRVRRATHPEGRLTRAPSESAIDAALPASIASTTQSTRLASGEIRDGLIHRPAVFSTAVATGDTTSDASCHSLCPPEFTGASQTVEARCHRVRINERSPFGPKRLLSVNAASSLELLVTPTTRGQARNSFPTLVHPGSCEARRG